MTKCVNCNKETNNPKFCNKSCSTTYNNKLSPKRTAKIGYCRNCQKEINHPKKYCNVSCHKEYEYNNRINDWLNNETSGLNCGVVSTWVKKWLRETRGDKCEICGWNEVNLTTGRVPVVADHIDGNWQNNRPENLRLLCPNHDSLQSTYKALNKGNGRPWRHT